MPRTDRANATREALLVSARTEFAAYGIAGARVDRIAERAGVNKERIYGYFGSKEKLFDLVIAQALDEFTGVVSGLSEDPGEYAGQIYDYHREHPELLRLMLWEGLYYRDDESLPGEEARLPHYRTKVENLARALGREPSGEVGRTLIMLCGLGAWPNAVPQIARMVLGPDLHDHEAMRRRVVEFGRAAVGRTEQSVAG